MKIKYAPLVAAIVLSGTVSIPVLAQGLPPTNMGKFVHQPGDNQYQSSAQLERHGTTYADRTGPGTSVTFRPGNPGGGGGGPMPGMAPMVVNPMTLMYGTQRSNVDISVDPIACDEPVPPAGFPPLPERLQLPVQPTGAWNRPTGRSGGGGGSSGGGGGGGSIVQGVHEHYVHIAPGGYQVKSGGGGGSDDGGGSAEMPAVPGAGGFQQTAIGGANPSQQITAPGGSRGYYKCTSAPPININKSVGGDLYMSGRAPGYNGASSRDLKALGDAPKLDDKGDASNAPEAPQAAIVSQSTTQDLSLPDDDFVSRYGLKDTAGKRFTRYVGRQTARTGQRVINRATGLIGF